MFTFPTPKSGYDATRQIKTAEKAVTVASELRKGGQYKAFVALDRPFSITKDEYDEKDRFTGETTYTVNLTAIPVPSCNCPDFEKHKDFCKHTLGVELALHLDERDAATEAQAKDYDALQAVLEPYGFAY